MDGQFKILENFINILIKRNSVLSSNIANAETPNYLAKDINYKIVLDEEMINLETTNEKHISLNSGPIKEEVLIEQNNRWLDKNNVELDKELAKLTENSLKYQASITFLGTKLRMYKNVIKWR